jgi:maleate cis-trans isomerase
MTIDDATGLAAPDATLHRKGTPEYEIHVMSEQQKIRDHTERMAGRALTDDEGRHLDEAVAEAIARHARS